MSADSGMKAVTSVDFNQRMRNTRRRLKRSTALPDYMEVLIPVDQCPMWFPERTSDLSETVGAVWDGFVQDLRQNGYLSVAAQLSALNERYERARIPEDRDVLAFRRLILERVLHNQIHYGYVPLYYEITGGESEANSADIGHDRLMKLGLLLAERQRTGDLFESFREFKDWIADVLHVSPSSARHIVGSHWVNGVSGRRSTTEVLATQQNLIEYALNPQKPKSN